MWLLVFHKVMESHTHLPLKVYSITVLFVSINHTSRHVQVVSLIFSVLKEAKLIQ